MLTKFGFTMAEILLSLTIIGVVAAITLPSLTGNINERTWNTQRKALYARFSQAIALMPSLNGYGTLTEESSSGAGDAVDTAAETFVTAGLAKVMKINNICDSEHLEDCGIASKFTTLKATVMSTPTKMSELNSDMVSTDKIDAITSWHLKHDQLDTKAAAFETGNGESIIVYYNPKCISDFDTSGTSMIQPKICANLIYDLNGTKGPNSIGKDMGFITILYSTDSSVVMPLPHLYDAGRASQPDASALCTQQDKEYRLPNRDELAALFANKNLLNISTGRYWSSSVIDKNSAYIIGIEAGDRTHGIRTETRPIRCVKR